MSQVPPEFTLAPTVTTTRRISPEQSVADLQRYGSFLEKLVGLCRQEGMVLTEFTHSVPWDERFIPHMRVTLAVHAGSLPAVNPFEQVDSATAHNPWREQP